MLNNVNPFKQEIGIKIAILKIILWDCSLFSLTESEWSVGRC